MKNPKPPYSERNVLLPSVLMPRRKEERALMTASLFLILVSLTYWCVRFRAPIFAVKV